MFKLFSKKTEQVVEVITAKKQYPAIVEQIHNEFYTAGDNILAEATGLLKQLEEKDLSKGKRLAALGFGKTREAAAAIETENKLANTKEIAELVVYYKLNYPNNKFITEEQVKQICEKYGLVCGETSMYKGFVPDVKLKMIESFKIKEKDEGVMLSNGIFLKGAMVWSNTNSKGYLHIIKKSDINNKYPDYAWQCDYGKNEFYSRDSKNLFNVGVEIGNFSVVGNLQICAPLKDMDIPSTKHIVGYRIFDKPVPDPVVLHAVKGGFLIIAAWGDEASDEIVVNEKLN